MSETEQSTRDATCEPKTNPHQMPHEITQVNKEESIIKSKELKIVTLNTAENFDVAIALHLTKALIHLPFKNLNNKTM
jgi:hypothetical protein